MSQRLRLLDCRLSDLPQSIGLCQSDINGIAQAVNKAERRLIMAKEAADEGWYGTFAEIAFNVSQTNPYVTLPRTVARMEAATVCNCPVPINNQFFEYLDFGNGRMPKIFAKSCRNLLQVYSRNNAPGFVDLTNPPQYIQVHFTDPSDVGKRVLVQGRDAAGNPIFNQDGLVRVQGVYGTLATPFTTIMAPGALVAFPFSAITGYQKDVTNGEVQFFQVDPTTGATALLHTMQPGETTGWYRRYYFDRLPFDCCTAQGPPSGCPAGVTPGQVQITAICKLEPIPVVYDTDYLLLQNLEAIIEECQANRYVGIDLMSAKGMSLQHHRNAIGLLNGELAHYFGLNTPAVSFAPFGDAKLERLNIGMV